MTRVCCVVLALSLCCSALDPGQAKYLGGTLDNSKIGVVGHLTLSSPGAVTYDAGTLRISIPYQQIVSYRYRKNVARHLGVLPAIVVGMFKARQRRHVFTIVYIDEQKTKQVAVFEVPKQAALSINEVLDAKGIRTCLQCELCNAK